MKLVNILIGIIIAWNFHWFLLFSTLLSVLDGRITELTSVSLGYNRLPPKLLGGFLLNLVCRAQSGYPSVFIQLQHVNTNPSLSDHTQIYTFFPPLWRCDPMRVMASSFLRFLDHTQPRNTVGRTPLDEWSARPRDLYLTTHNAHNIQTSMPLVGFEPTISAGERPQTYALDRAATGTGRLQ